MNEDTYDIYVKNTFLVFDIRDSTSRDAVQTESRDHSRGASCPPSWKVECAALDGTNAQSPRPTALLAGGFDLQLSKFNEATASTMAACGSCSDGESSKQSNSSECDTDSNAAVGSAKGEVDPMALEEIENHRKINRQLTAGGNAASILQLVDRNLHLMNGINLSTAFHRLARCMKNGPRSNSKQDQIVAAMLQVAEGKAMQELHLRDGTMPANCGTIILWSCAMLKVFPGPLFSTLIAVVAQSPVLLEVYEITNLLWACAQYQKAVMSRGRCSPPAFVGQVHESLMLLVRSYFAPIKLDRIKTSVLVSAFTSVSSVLPVSPQKRQALQDFRDILRRRVGELSELQRKLVFGPKGDRAMPRASP